MSSQQILIVDDEEKMQRILAMALKQLGYRTACASDGQEALRVMEQTRIDLVVTDLQMPKMDGIGLLRAIRERGEDLPVIVITAYGTVETAVEAMKLGASDYLLRPFELDAVELAINRALAMRKVKDQNRYLRNELDRGWGEFIGNSQAMQAVYQMIQQVAPVKTAVLIIGETGTGKELVARAIHNASGREGLFVAINCAAIPAEMLESELFGYAKGAFTGAHKDKAGKFELSSGGTLFLDEVTEMAPALQAKLLRALQESRIERLGENRSIEIDMRVIAATNRNPKQAVAEKRLREDLYYRLNVFSLQLPELKNRAEDIEDLANHFLDKYASEMGKPMPRLSVEALALLKRYEWPGNVRELENVIERAVVLLKGEWVHPEHLPSELAGSVPQLNDVSPAAEAEGSLALRPKVDELELGLIRRALNESGGNKSAAARVLEISERALWYKLKKYGLH